MSAQSSGRFVANAKQPYPHHHRCPGHLSMSGSLRVQGPWSSASFAAPGVHQETLAPLIFLLRSTVLLALYQQDVLLLDNIYTYQLLAMSIFSTDSPFSMLGLSTADHTQMSVPFCPIPNPSSFPCTHHLLQTNMEWLRTTLRSSLLTTPLPSTSHSLKVALTKSASVMRDFSKAPEVA